MSQICEPCGGANPVVMLLTRLDNGETDRACDQDLPIMLTGQLALWLGIDPHGLYDAVKKHADKVARDLAKAQAQADAPGPPPPGLDDTREDYYTEDQPSLDDELATTGTQTNSKPAQE